MSYPSYAYLKGLIDMAEGRLKHDFQISLMFIPNQTAKEIQKKYPSGVDRAHRILMEELAKIGQVRKELHAAVQAAYRDHPNPEMREFWGVEN